MHGHDHSRSTYSRGGATETPGGHKQAQVDEIITETVGAANCDAPPPRLPASLSPLISLSVPYSVQNISTLNLLGFYPVIHVVQTVPASRCENADTPSKKTPLFQAAAASITAEPQKPEGSHIIQSKHFEFPSRLLSWFPAILEAGRRLHSQI